MVVRILGVSGSLRAASINSMLLRATIRLAPPDMSVSIFPALGELPLFNPDCELNPPMSIVIFQQAVAQADAIILASPEYAHGVSGTMKNALDWLVGFEPFASKVVAVWNTSPRAQHADAALRETLRTMAAVLVEKPLAAFPLLGSGLDESAMVASTDIAQSVREALSDIRRTVLMSPSADGVPGLSRPSRTSAAAPSATDDAACAAPSPRSAGCARA